jgi:protein-L-isoaspartate(D-aspartate) O-methyltransferase
MRVLDVGTGSGYQAAILAAMGADVVSIERYPELAEEARERFGEMAMDPTIDWPVGATRLDAIEVVTGDGSEGWPQSAPYAGIVVAAAAPRIPEPLVEQLAEGGVLAVPVGRLDHQELVQVRREGDRRHERWLEPCVFVPLVGRYGFDGG